MKLSSGELSPQAKDLIKQNGVYFSRYGLDITKVMYDKLFKKYPCFKDMFKFAPKDQPILLAESLASFAVNIDRLNMLKPALNIIAISHVRTRVRSHHYRMLGPVLMEAIEEVLKDKIDIHTMDAFREAYKYISDILIEIEEGIYINKKIDVDTETICF